MFNGLMSDARQPHQEQQPQRLREPKQVRALPDKGRRSGQGSSSVLPHLRADQRARAVARIAKRADREF